MGNLNFIILILFLFLLAVYYDKGFVVKTPAEYRTVLGKKGDRDKKRYLLIVCVIFYILTAFRDVSVGMDTKSYCLDFMNITHLDFGRKEQGYTLLTYLISIVYHSPRFFLIITSAFFPICFYFYLKDEQGSCLYIFFSILVVMTIGIFSFTFTGIRQTIAISFILVAYKYLKQKNFWRYLFWIFVAFLFHYSALVFLLAYPLKHVKSLVLPWCLFVGVFIVGTFFPDEIMRFVSKTIFGDIYGNYGTDYKSENSYSMLIIQIGLLVAPLFYHKKIVKNLETRRIFNTAFLMIYFQALTPVIAEFFRIAYYFSVALCLLLPRTLAEIPDKNSRQLVFYGLTSIMILYLAVFGNVFIDYKFFF